MKPILALGLKNVVIDASAWDLAHKYWFETMALRLQDESVKQWIGQPDYFVGVDRVMAQAMPDASEEERTRAARALYMKSVVKYVQEEGEVLQENVDALHSLQDSYHLALCTTNTKDTVDAILNAVGLTNMFDIVVASEKEEKDDKQAVFQRLWELHGQPIAYVGNLREDTKVYLEEHGVKYYKPEQLPSLI